MYKLVVLLAAVAAASAEPSVGLAYTSPLAYSALPAYSAPLAYSNHLGYSAPFGYSSPLTYGAPWGYAAPVHAAVVGEPALAPGQPATVLKANGVPVDTLDVVSARAQHYTAKALNGGYHLLKKRSVGHAAYAPALYSAPAVVAARSVVSPAVYSAPHVAYSTPALAYSRAAYGYAPSLAYSAYAW